MWVRWSITWDIGRKLILARLLSWLFLVTKLSHRLLRSYIVETTTSLWPIPMDILILLKLQVACGLFRVFFGENLHIMFGGRCCHACKQSMVHDGIYFIFFKCKIINLFNLLSWISFTIPQPKMPTFVLWDVKSCPLPKDESKCRDMLDNIYSALYANCSCTHITMMAVGLDDETPTTTVNHLFCDMILVFTDSGMFLSTN